MENDNTQKNILVVDDDENMLDALSEKLKSSGFQVILAHDGEEGFDMALAKKPDFIILDVIMPKEDGLNMLKKLRQDEWGKNVSVMILTNNSDSDKLAEALEMGVDEYAIKSDIKLSDIVEKIKKILGLG